MNAYRIIDERTGLPRLLLAGAAAVALLFPCLPVQAQSDVSQLRPTNVDAPPLTMGAAATPLSMGQSAPAPLSMNPISELGGGAGHGVAHMGGHASSSLKTTGQTSGVIRPKNALPAIPVASPNQLPQGDLSLSRDSDTQKSRVSAQSSVPLNSAEFAKLDDSLRDHAAISPPATAVSDLKTLFFTAWQYALLNEAKEKFKTRPPTASEINNPNAKAPTGPREISLDGISYRDSKHWTVWLNHKRIEPDAIPKQILDIKVKSDHIDLKWFDAATNLIFPIRLRPHQRFNLDDRIFLPGAGT